METDGNLCAFNAATATTVWTASAGLRWSPMVGNGIVYLSSECGRVDAFDATTGTPMWTADTVGARVEGARSTHAPPHSDSAAPLSSPRFGRNFPTVEIVAPGCDLPVSIDLVHGCDMERDRLVVDSHRVEPFDEHRLAD
jgi:putative pyrroloquinoline-quinone binding quinoprotein